MKALMRAEMTAGDDGVDPAILEGTSLSRIYRQGDREVAGLRGVDVAIRHGEFVAITGPSGSGKSTLMHLLGGLDRPDKGEVILEGRFLTSMNDKELAAVRRRRVGFVLQFFNLLPTLTAEENVAFPLLLDGAADAIGRAEESLDSVGLAERYKHRPAQMSGGEQQRVALARALVTQPALILADEPTGNLDSLTGEEILQVLRDTADRGQTIVMVTHDLKAASYADRIVRIVDGQIVDESIL
ncbi:MAG: ABC transporter ATP-binding protein [Actinomycetota bacterium]